MLLPLGDPRHLLREAPGSAVHRLILGLSIAEARSPVRGIIEPLGLEAILAERIERFRLLAVETAVVESASHRTLRGVGLPPPPPEWRRAS